MILTDHKSGAVDILIFIPESLTEDDLEFRGESVTETLSKKFRDSGFFGNIFISIHESHKLKFSENEKIITRAGEDDVDFWKNFFSENKSAHCAKIQADSPFIDLAVVKEMCLIHLKYLAEYTYSENLPPGLAAEIFSKELIDALPEIKEKTLPLAQVVKSNINSFDVEIFYKEPDIRDKRISFLSSNRRDRRIMENIFNAAGGIPPYEKIRSLIDSDPAMLYIGPSYVEIEPAGVCQIDCIFCYRKFLKNERGEMSLDIFRKIISGMREFDLPYSLCFGGSGEPLMCGSIYTMLKEASDEPLVETIVVETNAVMADANFKSFISSPDEKKIRVIANVCGYDSGTYKTLHGADLFAEVFNNVISLAELNSSGADKIYVQLMKINETKETTDRYYDFWEKHKVPIIFMKHNRYMGMIPDRAYSDLSPLDRFPCWHLQRELFISADGDVGFCRQDVNILNSIGSIKEKSVKEIFEGGISRFLADYKGGYAKSPDCRSCDEWYAFNL